MESVKFKLRLDETKWVKLSSPVTYGDVVKIAKTKFPKLENVEDFTFYDIDGCILEEDFLTDYIQERKDSVIVIKENNDGAPLQNLDVNSLSTITELSTNTTNSPNNTSNNAILLTYINEQDSFLPTAKESMSISSNHVQYGTQGTPSVIKKDGNISAEELKEIILTRNGKGIFDEHEKIKCLSNAKRRLLVNITVSVMIERYGYNIPVFIKQEYAKAIIEMLPSLRDPHGKHGYEAFYNLEQHNGYLEWRFRNEKRKCNIDKKIEKGTEKRKLSTDSDKETPEKKYSKDEVIEKIKWLKSACPQRDREEIFEKMRETIYYRKNMKGEECSQILNLFPRFIDLPELIERDFSLSYPNRPTLLEVLPEYCHIILQIYNSTTQNPKKEIIGNKEDDWEEYDESTRAIFALLHMLAPTAKGKKRSCRGSYINITNKLVVFKKTNVTFEDILKLKSTLQPFLIFEGTCPASTAVYHMCVDGKLITLPKTTSSIEAFDFLFMSHFVFQTKFDPDLELFWEFIQQFFYQLDGTPFTAKMRELRSRILNKYQEQVV